MEGGVIVAKNAEQCGQKECRGESKNIHAKEGGVNSMKAILEFNLPEDRSDYNLASNAYKWYAAMHERGIL